LDAVIGELNPALAVLSRRVSPTIDGTPISIASLTLQEELYPFSAA
jgi:hypothetical protein